MSTRPSKNAPAPPPLYSNPEHGKEAKYCHTCGRVISSKSTGKVKTVAPEAKYCSSRCRGRKPGKLDGEIEAVFVRLLGGGDTETLNGGSGAGKGKGSVANKGGGDGLVSCDEVEKVVFGRLEALGGDDPGVDGGGGGSAAASSEGCEDQATRQAKGQRKAEEREMVRRAARRGCVFGFYPAGRGRDEIETALRKCEAVQNGRVVEPSFAKGDFGIRWRDGSI